MQPLMTWLHCSPRIAYDGCIVGETYQVDASRPASSRGQAIPSEFVWYFILLIVLCHLNIGELLLAIIIGISKPHIIFFHATFPFLLVDALHFFLWVRIKILKIKIKSSIFLFIFVRRLNNYLWSNLFQNETLTITHYSFLALKLFTWE